MRVMHSPGHRAIFADRTEAGRALARALAGYRGRPDVVVLALPRGGVPVGYEVATYLRAPLDVLIVRKLGVPWQPELAMGAIASGGVCVVNEDVTQALAIDRADIARVAAREGRELERREKAYRGDRGPVDVSNKTVIVVDDGVATGSTMRAAVRALREREVARIVIAVPHAPPDTCALLEREADQLVCLETPEPYIAVGNWYRDFPQMEDEDVRVLLADAHGGTGT